MANGFNLQPGGFLNALLGAGIGLQAGASGNTGALNQFQQLTKRNQRQQQLNEIQAAGGINSPAFQQLLITNPELAKELLATQQQQFKTQRAGTTAQASEFELEGLQRKREAGDLAKEEREDILGGNLTALEKEKAIVNALIRDPQAGKDALQSANLLDKRSQNEAGRFAVKLKNTTKDRRPKLIQDRVFDLESRGIPADETRQLLGKSKEEQDNIANTVLASMLSLEEQIKIAAGVSTLNKSTLKVFKDQPLVGGGRGIITFDTKTGEAKAVPIPGVFGETDVEKREGKTASAIATEKGKQTQKQRNKIESDIVFNAQQSARTKPLVQNLLTILENVETGKFADAKRLLGPFLPGVDPSDEQALNAELNKLIFVELQKFKGATSEKELKFAAETTARFGNTTKANIIILKRLLTTLDVPLRERKEFFEFKKTSDKFEEFLLSDQTEQGSPSQQVSTQIQKNISNLGRPVNAKDITETAEATGLTEDEVRQRLGL